MQQKYLYLQERIAMAAHRSGRSPEEIIFVGVSKTVDIETTRMAYELGIRDFGENRVPALIEKHQAIPEAKWHMIGRLQTNKVKDVVGQTCLIHSMDRWNLAEEISKRGGAVGIEVPVLLEVNVSGEEQKAGTRPEEVKSFLQNVGQLPFIKVSGFMTMAPISDEAEDSRLVFRELKNLFEDLSRDQFHNVDLKYLSMGMSQDFEIAVEEGANIVRIGSALFA